MTTALTINDLAINQELDRKMMTEVLGRGRVAYEYLGSSGISTTAWQYTGQYYKNFVGNTYLSGHGWVQKYRTGYKYQRTQTKWNYFNEFYK